MESRGKKAARAGVGYTIGNILVRGISFISMPIFARLMTLSDYGIYNTFTSYVNIFALVVGFALHSSIKNANIDNPEKVNDYTSSVSLLILFSAAFWAIIAVIFRIPIAILLSLEHPYLLVLVVLESLGISLISFYNCYLAIEYKYKEYLILSLIFASLGIGLSIAMILTVCSGERYLGRIIGTLVAALVMGAYILIRLYKKAKPKINKEFWKYGLRISLPLIPHGLSQVLLSQFDRIMIKKIIGSAESGLYSFAYNILTIFSVIASSLDTAWTQWFFEQMRQENYAKIRKVANIYAGLLGVFMIALFLISPEAILILGGEKYMESRIAVYPVLMAGFFGFMYYFPSAIEYYHKKTKMIAVATMIAAGLNVVLNLIFIPKYGYVAAAYTTLACYIIYYIIHIFFSRRIQGSFLYDMKIHLLIILGVAVFAFGCLFAVDLMWIRLSVFCAGLIAAVIFAVVRKDITKKVINIFLKR